ncbi:MAG: hypothetical protein LBT74_05620 [Acidobacteriota bacterium]|jgi:hypothetical protein|nr:hypothetical protein [Acidobacteriota bacterium]
MSVISLALLLLAVAFSQAFAAASAGGDATPSPVELRRRLVETAGAPPAAPYALEGRFTLVANGEELSWRARVVHIPQPGGGRGAGSADRRVTDLAHENGSRDVRYFLSGDGGWIATKETTMDVEAASIPYPARLDFHTLYAALLDMLADAPRGVPREARRGKNAKVAPAVKIEPVDNEIHVSGRLPNGWDAVFALNAVECYPRKVRISTGGEPVGVLTVPVTRPGKGGQLRHPAGLVTEFEVWMSEPAPGSGYRYARRLDFVEQGVVVGALLAEEAPFAAGAQTPGRLFDRPPDLPWVESLHFESDGRDGESVFAGDAGLAALRARIEAGEEPWAGWSRRGGLIASGAVVLSWIGMLFPYPPPPRTLGTVIAIGYLLFFLIAVRVRQMRDQRFPKKTALAALAVAAAVFVSGCASWMVSRPVERSRMALHAALRYALTGRASYADGAVKFLPDAARKSSAKAVADMVELGESCQGYALAYDLVKGSLPPSERARAEAALFDYARPLMGAASGWGANGVGAGEIAAGLGMAGLALRFEPFVAAAQVVIDRALDEQLSGGLHKAGPGRGAGEMNAAVNLFAALRQAGRADYYADERVRRYVSTTLQLLSPAGTLPLFTDTELEHSLDLSMFFLKVADKLPEADGRRCVAAHDRYWGHGRFADRGWRGKAFRLVQPLLAYYDNPQVMLQYTRPVPSGGTGGWRGMPSRSVVAASGQFAALRTGDGADAMCLALDMLRPGACAEPGDALSFDLFAEQSLMLHGLGAPLKDGKGVRAAAGNTLTFDGANQAANRSRGVTSALLNQPLFDQLRATADKAYDYGQVRRDIVMVRPEQGFPAYFIVLDDVASDAPQTTVQWRIHGRGETTSGIDSRTRWSSTPLVPPRWREKPSVLEVVHPLGAQRTQSISAGTLRSRFPFLNQTAQTALVEWVGSGRLCTVMIPRREADAPPAVDARGEYACLIGGTDWFSFGDTERRVTSGAFAHVSEYSLVRDRKGRFPAMLMAFGVECRFGTHSIESDKPVTVSLDGLRGGVRNSRPATHVVIRSPDVRAGARFLLDGEPVVAAESGVLRITLEEPGEHALAE